MTITFVVPFINLTGGIRVLLDYANWLHDGGHRVTVVYPAWPYRFQYTRRQQWGEFRKHLAHDGRVPWFDLRCRLVKVPLVRSMFMPRADVIVAAGWPVVHDVAALPPRAGRKVQIVFHHESGTGPEDGVSGVYRLPFYRIAFSRFVKETTHARFDCTVHDVVPNGVDTKLFFPEGNPVPASVLMLYHSDPRKGADIGLQALTLLRTRLPEAAIHLCGTVRPSTLPSGMPFEFHPDDAVLRRRYSTSAVLLYPSCYEGYGLPPLEAMACGCPPVTTAVGAIPEFAVHDRNALVVPVGDAGAMAARVEQLLRHPELRGRLSAEGRRTANERSLARVAPLFEEALRRSLDSPC